MGAELHPVLVEGLGRHGERVVHHRLDAELAELAQDVGHLAVADIVAVLLEVRPRTPTRAPFTVMSASMSSLTTLLGDVRPHVVVDAAPGEDDLRLVAELLGLHREVVRVDPDAVTADQARPEPEEVPLRARGGEDVARPDAHAVEDDGKLVHERDVQVALRVLDDLRGLGHLDGSARGGRPRRRWRRTPPPRARASRRPRRSRPW